MPNNINHIENIACDLRVSREDAVALLALDSDELPEGCFISDDLREAFENDPDAKEFLITGITWYGECSTYTWESVFLDKVVPRLQGNADFVLVMENGEFEGWQLRNGEATQCHVSFTLTPLEEA